MEKKLTKRDEVTKLLKELFAISKKISFTDCKLKDGSILRTSDDALAKGSQVTLVGADGTSAPAPDGDHTAEDGTTVSIKSGVVDNIAPAAMAAEGGDTATYMTTVGGGGDTPERKAMDVAPVDAPADMDGGDMGTIAGIIQNLTDRIAKLEESISSTSMTVEKMSAAPAAKPFSFDPHQEFSKGTIGDVLENWKKEKNEKKSSKKQAMLEFNSKRIVEAPSKLVEKPRQNFNQTSTNAKPNESFNTGLFPGSFSIDSGK